MNGSGSHRSPPPSQLSFRWVGIGLLAGMVLVFGLVGLGVATADRFVADWIVAAILYALPALGLALVVLPGRPTRRSFGAGVMMGWGAGFIISAGLCVSGAITTPFIRIG